MKQFEVLPTLAGLPAVALRILETFEFILSLFNCFLQLFGYFPFSNFDWIFPNDRIDYARHALYDY